MREKIVLLLVGLVAGALIGALVPAQAHHGDDFRALKRKVRVLTLKTRGLDRSGLYFGPIVGLQVLSECDAGTSAVWSQVAIDGYEDYRWIESCMETTGARKSFKRMAKVAPFLKG